MNKDLLFRFDEGIFNVRAAGILIKDNMILLQKESGGSEYALPGGQIRMNEAAEDALKREFIEETGAGIRVERLLFTEECFWSFGGTARHTVTLYFSVSETEDTLYAKENAFTPQKDNKNVVWGFVPLDAVPSLTVYPDFLSDALKIPSFGVRNYVSRY